MFSYFNVRNLPKFNSLVTNLPREKGEVRNGTVLLPIFPNPALTENLFQKTGYYSVWARFARKKKDYMNTHLCLSVSYHTIFVIKFEFQYVCMLMTGFEVSGRMKNHQLIHISSIVY